LQIKIEIRSTIVYRADIWISYRIKLGCPPEFIPMKMGAGKKDPERKQLPVFCICARGDWRPRWSAVLAGPVPIIIGT
jgi:hypothetical protein